MVDKKRVQKASGKKPQERKAKGILTKKSLHGAIKGLLSDMKKEYPKTTYTSNTNVPSMGLDSLPSQIKKSTNTSNHVKRQRKSKRDSQLEYIEKNGIIYIKSKEDKLIPKLTDDEVMARHKKADETMRNVWTKIIEKYETITDQGDVLNLQTGEIIEDHGHLRGENSTLPSVKTTVTSYKTTMDDIFLPQENPISPTKMSCINDNKTDTLDENVWNDNDKKDHASNEKDEDEWL